MLALGLWNDTLLVADNPINGFPIMPVSAVAATFLGGIESLVHPRDENGPVFVAQHLCHAKTHGYSKLLFVVTELALLNRLARSHGCLGSVVQVRPRKYDRKLLATITSHEVHFAHLPADQSSHAPQHLVASLMPVRVIELLELVHVGHYQREGPAVTAELGDTAGEFVVERSAIGEQREGIRAGLSRMDLHLLCLDAKFVLGRVELRLHVLIRLNQLRHHINDHGWLVTAGRGQLVIDLFDLTAMFVNIDSHAGRQFM